MNTVVTPTDHPGDAGKKLPDPALRSCLINYRPAKTRSIKIIDEDPRELYDILVLKGRAMRFLPAKEPSPDPGEKGYRNLAPLHDNRRRYHRRFTPFVRYQAGDRGFAGIRIPFCRRD